MPEIISKLAEHMDPWKMNLRAIANSAIRDAFVEV